MPPRRRAPGGRSSSKASRPCTACAKPLVLGLFAAGSLASFATLYRGTMSRGPGLARPAAVAVESIEQGEERRVRSEGRLFFLFLLEDGLPHIEVWSAFFASAPRGAYDALAHCRDRGSCERQIAMKRLGIETVASVASKRCVNVVSPVYEMLRRAIARAGNASQPQKFILVGDAMLPLKPLAKVREILLKHATSDICTSPQQEWASGPVQGSTYAVVKHHQWIVLSRRDAELFVRNWPRLSRYDDAVVDSVYTLEVGDYRWLVPLMGRDGFANISRTFQRKAIGVPNRCLEEEAFTTAIFGLYETAKHRKWADLFSNARCRTYINWKCENPPEIFARVTPALQELARNSSEGAYLFAGLMDAKASFSELLPLIRGRR